MGWWSSSNDGSNASDKADKSGASDKADKAAERVAAKDSAKESPMEKAYLDYKARQESESLWSSIFGKHK